MFSYYTIFSQADLLSRLLAGICKFASIWFALRISISSSARRCVSAIALLFATSTSSSFSASLLLFIFSYSVQLQLLRAYTRQLSSHRSGITNVVFSGLKCRVYLMLEAYFLFLVNLSRTQFLRFLLNRRMFKHDRMIEEESSVVGRRKAQS